MSGARTAAVLVGDGPLADGLLASLGIAAARVSPAALVGRALRVSPVADELEPAVEIGGHADRLVWIHLMPAAAAAGELGEAELLLASAAAARQTAAGRALVFLGLVPAAGLFAGERGRASDLGRASLSGLIENEIVAWSADGDRIVGIVYGGIECGQPGRRADAEVSGRIPMGRLGRVEELAGAVAYLGSGAASYVTGALLHVDGGWRAYSWIYPARTI